MFFNFPIFIEFDKNQPLLERVDEYAPATCKWYYSRFGVCPACLRIYHGLWNH